MKGLTIAFLVTVTLLVLASLTLNAVVVAELLWWRHFVVARISDIREVIDGIGEATFSYTFEVDQEIPIDASIPFVQEFTVPINTTVPVSTTVLVPIDLGFTAYTIAVPINTVFPVDIELTVPVSQTVDVVTTLPMDVDIPVEIAITETPVVGYLEDLDATLAELAEQMERPIWQDN